MLLSFQTPKMNKSKKEQPLLLNDLAKINARYHPLQSQHHKLKRLSGCESICSCKLCKHLIEDKSNQLGGGQGSNAIANFKVLFLVLLNFLSKMLLFSSHPHVDAPPNPISSLADAISTAATPVTIFLFFFFFFGNVAKPAAASTFCWSVF